ncbi:MAG: hypothetical protein FD174_1315 [Geobacteraceae bacterium]|nr:MAG: hypothetical protein FD174_1315 [Geobacteraceae bacterium]
MIYQDKLPVVSLFSGAGGLDLGFGQAGFQTIFAADYNSAAVNTFNANSGYRNIARQLDLSTVSIHNILNMIEDVGIKPVGAIGGPPCQGFSRGNNRSSADDPRNVLPLKYAELIAGLRDKFDIDFFVFENVPGLRDTKHAETYTLLKQSLDHAGFALFEDELDSSRFSIPQIRRRVIFVGINRVKYPDIDFSFPTGRAHQRTIRDAIGHLPEPVFFSRHLTPDQIPFHKNHWTMVPKSRKFIEGIEPGGRSFKRLCWNEKSPTVAYGHREIHVHPDGKRRLSIYEAMLLQGFPKKYLLTGNLSAQVEQISNAVPPPVAKAIALAIKKTIFTTTGAC